IHCFLLSRLGRCRPGGGNRDTFRGAGTGSTGNKVYRGSLHSPLESPVSWRSSRRLSQSPASSIVNVTAPGSPLEPPPLLRHHDEPPSSVGACIHHRSRPSIAPVGSRRRWWKCPVTNIDAAASGPPPWVCFAHQSRMPSGR